MKGNTANFLKSTLPPPKRPNQIPTEAQWLAGEGAGSWFSIKKEVENYSVYRYSSTGELECFGEFSVLQNVKFEIEQPFTFVHLSHCSKVTIYQFGVIITFERISD